MDVPQGAQRVLGRLASIREKAGRRVHTPHTFAFAFAGGFSAPKRALFYGVEWTLGRATDRLVCVSPSEADQARSLRVCAPDRIRVVENGIDARAFLEAPARADARAGPTQGAGMLQGAVDLLTAELPGWATLLTRAGLR